MIRTVDQLYSIARNTERLEVGFSGALKDSEGDTIFTETGYPFLLDLFNEGRPILIYTYRYRKLIRFLVDGKDPSLGAYNIQVADSD